MSASQDALLFVILIQQQLHDRLPRSSSYRFIVFYGSNIYQTQLPDPTLSSLRELRDLPSSVRPSSQVNPRKGGSRARCNSRSSAARRETFTGRLSDQAGRPLPPGYTFPTPIHRSALHLQRSLPLACPTLTERHLAARDAHTRRLAALRASLPLAPGAHLRTRPGTAERVRHLPTGVLYRPRYPVHPLFGVPRTVPRTTFASRSRSVWPPARSPSSFNTASQGPCLSWRTLSTL